MPPHLSAHEPVAGEHARPLGRSGDLWHLPGVVVAGPERLGRTGSGALALVWNVCSLIVLLMERGNERVEQWLVVAATSALSLLPALLLEISLDGRLRWASRLGYLMSGVAVALHTAELWMPGAQLHTMALVVTAAGFAALTLVALGLELRRSVSVRRASAAMALVLFALSFSHFHAGGSYAQWPYELMLHHAGIPLALFVLLQDYRFVLLDAFLRFLTNILLAAAFVWALSGLIPVAATGERQRALVVLAGCAAFVLFGLARSAAQSQLTSLLFRPDDPARAVERLRQMRPERKRSFWGRRRRRWRAHGSRCGRAPGSARCGSRGLYLRSDGRAIRK